MPALRRGRAVRAWTVVRVPFEAIPFAEPTPTPTRPEPKGGDLRVAAAPSICIVSAQKAFTGRESGARVPEIRSDPPGRGCL